MGSKRKTFNTNLASEFYVASQLFRLGHSVTITLGHTKEIDLYVTNFKGSTITIDVKGLKNKTNWPIMPKLISKGHFFVLVSYLNKYNNLNIQPSVFVIPSTKIRKMLGPWAGRPNVTALSYRKVKGSKYENAWHLLFD